MAHQELIEAILSNPLLKMSSSPSTLRENKEPIANIGFETHQGRSLLTRNETEFFVRSSVRSSAPNFVHSMRLIFCFPCRIIAHACVDSDQHESM